MTAPRHVVIAGGTGFLGRRLASCLTARGVDVAVLARHAPAVATPWRHVTWDGRTLGPWVHELDGADALVNLAGRSVDCVKTPDHCDDILRSRIESTRVLGRALAQLEAPRVWVQMSTAHIYGDPAHVICDEDAALGYGLAPSVAREWEETFAQAVPRHTRRVVLRTSFVLGRDGGALPRLARLVRLGLGGRAGSGEQGISWIHQDDMTRLFERAITDERMSGAYLATAPRPVSNAEFMRELRRVLKRPLGLPATGWMIRIGAPVFLRTDPDLALYGRYCVSRRLDEERFPFRFPDLASALRNLYGDV